MMRWCFAYDAMTINKYVFNVKIVTIGILKMEYINRKYAKME